MGANKDHSTKVVEELCSSSGCLLEGTHWHVLDLEDLRGEDPGEYTITVRVRQTRRPHAKRMPNRARKK